MEPPRERFERGVSEQEERIKELLDNFKTEMMERFQEQEERIGRQEEKNAEQDLKISKQNETILKLKDTLAEQKKTIEDQNETIQKIATYPALRDLLHASRTPSPPPQDNLLFITGGHKGPSRISATETYPRSSNCSPPSLPLDRSLLTTFVTSEPSAVVATCGGSISNDGRPTASCLVLDPVNKRWDETRMGNLTKGRYEGAAATLNNIGVFIVGGWWVSSSNIHTSNPLRRTTEFLAAGTMQWQEGPALPVDMYHPCAVEIGPTSFLSIHGTDIREFDAAIAGPTSNEGWQEAGRWPALKTYRSGQPGCAKIGQKVIIAGGKGRKGETLSSTEVLDLINRRITSGGEMAMPRRGFHIATVISGGEEKMFALAGDNDNDSLPPLATMEEWVEESSTWKAADNLVQRRYVFDVVTAPAHLVC